MGRVTVDGVEVGWIIIGVRIQHCKIKSKDLKMGFLLYRTFASSPNGDQ